MWWDIAPEKREEFQEWHSREHFPERMSIPGFLRGSRWTDIDGGNGFFVMYELASYSVLTSEAYLGSLNHPTPWSMKMMPHHLHMVRSQCKVLTSHGAGLGRAMLTVRLSPEKGREQSLLSHLEKTLEDLSRRTGVTGAHLLQTSTPKMSPTKEQAIRGGVDATADWIVLLSSYEAAPLRAEKEVDLSPDELIFLGATPQIQSAIYEMSFSMGAHDLVESQ